MTPVSRRARLIDVSALLLILAGIALYLDASARLRTILTYSYQHPGPRGRSQLAAVDWAGRESNGGLGLVVLGSVVGAASALRHARGKRGGVS